MKKSLILGLGLILYAANGMAAGKSTSGTKLYKWVDDQGETHYGQVIPPEYADKDRTMLNGKGQVIPDKSDKKDAASKKSSTNEETLEQRRKDMALLNTYSNVKEIELARKRNLQQVEARLEGIQMQLKTIKQNLQDLEKERAPMVRSNKPIPESLTSDINAAKTRQAKLEDDLKEAQAKEAAVKETYDGYKKRYLELTSGAVK